MTKPIISLFFIPEKLKPEKPLRLALDHITLDDRLQVRKPNPVVVKDYVAALRRGEVFPPIQVVLDHNEVYLLVDGFHRIAGNEGTMTNMPEQFCRL